MTAGRARRRRYSKTRDILSDDWSKSVMGYGFILMGLLIGACALFYYRAAELENASGLAWAGLSLLVSILCWRLFRFGWIGMLLGQVALFIGITIYRASKKN